MYWRAGAFGSLGDDEVFQLLDRRRADVWDAVEILQLREGAEFDDRRCGFISNARERNEFAEAGGIHVDLFAGGGAGFLGRRNLVFRLQSLGLFLLECQIFRALKKIRGGGRDSSCGGVLADL